MEGFKEEDFKAFDPETGIKEFELIDNDDWDSLLLVGIPLYNSLKSNEDDRAIEVKNRLDYLKMSLENSGAGNKDNRKRMIEKIEGI